ncbi:hypothetical protein BH23ACT9_BH23ACT9_27130 [soil metagenome]
MRVTACIVSYNTAGHLPGAISSLLAQTHPDLQVVVVDNNSHDSSAAVARRHPEVRVIANRVNRGFAGAANQGVALAGEGAFFVLNPDVRVDPGHVAAAVAALETSADTASVQGRLRRMDAEGGVLLTDDGVPIIDTTGHDAHRNRVFRNRGEDQPDDGRFDIPAEVFGVSGAAALYRLDALHDVAVHGEVYDEDLFAFFEDVDLDWRLKARGWRSRYAPDALGLHERGGIGVRRSAVVERLSYRNWFLTVAKNDDWAAMRPDAHLLAATTLLRTADLAITVPTAFLKALGDIRILRHTLRKRAVAERRRTVGNDAIVEQWFGAFDYVAWFRKRILRGW